MGKNGRSRTLASGNTSRVLVILGLLTGIFALFRMTGVVFEFAADNLADIAVGGLPGTDLATETLVGGVCLAALFVCFAAAAVLLAGSMLGTTGLGVEVLFGSFVPLLVATGVVAVVEFSSVALFLYFCGFSNLSQGGQYQLIGIFDSSSFTI